MSYDRGAFRSEARQAAGDATWTIGMVFVRILLPMIILVGGAGFLTRGFGLLEQKTFAPAEEQIRHDVFKNSQAYNDGMANELDSMFLEYQKADDAGKAALRSVVLHRVASYDTSRLPAHLQKFVNDLRQGR